MRQSFGADAMRTKFLVGTLLSLVVGSVSADAHALLDHANPRAGDVLRTAPHEVTLWFTQDLEPSFSTVEVSDASGVRVDTGKPMVDGQDHKVMRISVKSLPPGTYKVSWRALSVDTHTTEGTFTFRVGE
jgi:copper resistance protein C